MIKWSNSLTIRQFENGTAVTVAFKKLKPNRIFQRVVDQIQTAILDGSLKPDDLLPSEMKLKDMFDTSRGTIREALRVLEQKGLIEIKVGVGGGAFVREVDARKITEGLDLLIQSQKVSLEQLAEFRQEVEGVVTALAAKRVTRKDIKRLNDMLSEAQGLLKQKGMTWKEFVKIDIQIHITIAKIAKNPVFEAILQMVHENILGYYERFSLKDKHILDENYKDLCAIVSALEQKNVGEARSLARQHVRKFTEYMGMKNQKPRRKKA